MAENCLYFGSIYGHNTSGTLRRNLVWVIKPKLLCKSPPNRVCGSSCWAEMYLWSDGSLNSRHMHPHKSLNLIVDIIASSWKHSLSLSFRNRRMFLKYVIVSVIFMFPGVRTGRPAYCDVAYWVCIEPLRRSVNYHTCPVHGRSTSPQPEMAGTIPDARQ